MSLLPEVTEHFSKRIMTYTNWKSPMLYCSCKKSINRVLEIGCGAKFSFDTNSEKFGIDVTRVLLKKMREKNPDINLVMADARYLPFKNKTFDVAGAVFVLHHLVGRTISICKNNVKKCIQEVYRVTTADGQFMVLEHLSLNKIYSATFFLTTYLLANLGLNVEFLDIREKVVTYYLDENTLRNLAQKFSLRAVTSERWHFRGITLGYDKQLLLQKVQ